MALSIHPIGGFGAISRVLPLPPRFEIELKTNAAVRNGMNAQIDDTIHCIASEPHACFLRVGVTDGGQEVAMCTVVLGRLRMGYRAFQLRSSHGTRIELAYLFVRISLHSVRNRSWISSQQVCAPYGPNAFVLCILHNPSRDWPKLTTFALCAGCAPPQLRVMHEDFDELEPGTPKRFQRLESTESFSTAFQRLESGEPFSTAPLET